MPAPVFFCFSAWGLSQLSWELARLRRYGSELYSIDISGGSCWPAGERIWEIKASICLSFSGKILSGCFPQFLRGSLSSFSSNYLRCKPAHQHTIYLLSSPLCLTSHLWAPEPPPKETTCTQVIVSGQYKFLCWVGLNSFGMYSLNTSCDRRTVAFQLKSQRCFTFLLFSLLTTQMDPNGEGPQVKRK